MADCREADEYLEKGKMTLDQWYDYIKDVMQRFGAWGKGSQQALDELMEKHRVKMVAEKKNMPPKIEMYTPPVDMIEVSTKPFEDVPIEKPVEKKKDKPKPFEMPF